RDAILFAIYTGLRQEEQFSLTWAQIDLARKHLVVSAETAKGKRERTVILIMTALDVLARTPR
ncbi:tyrosine-type recombinase/integrase, partial [Pseudomonas aeruginosa]